MQEPHVQEWLEQQRQKIAELLRSIGEELDPQTRRSAEAFAFEGQTPTNDEAIRREAQASRDATAVATGRSMSGSSTIRRIPISGPTDPDMAEERKRMGQVYLIKREQQMLEMQQRRSLAMSVMEGVSLPSKTPSFDALVDADGNLKATTSEEKEVASSMIEQLPEKIQEEVKQAGRQLEQSVSLGESSTSAARGWQLGSSIANPFGDEYELERSITPRPPVPPKVALDAVPDPEISVPSEAVRDSATEQEPLDHDALSYEEQLAIALSLSEQESGRSSTRSSAIIQQDDHEDDDLRAAIAASLRDFKKHQVAHGMAPVEPAVSNPQPLVDLSPAAPVAPQPRRGGVNNWESLFAPHPSSAEASLPIDPPYHYPMGSRVGFAGSAYPNFSSLAQQSVKAPSEVSDELYRITPQLTRAHLASHDASNNSSTRAYDPVRDLVEAPSTPTQAGLGSSFYSAVFPATTTQTLDHEPATLIDVSEDVAEGARTPTSQAPHSVGFHTESESDTDTFASVSAPHSQARSEVSAVEVVPVEDDSDVDMLSEEGDGVITPDSWSEVDENDVETASEAESDADHMHHHNLVGA